MPTLLHVSVSPRGSASQGRRAAANVIAHWRTLYADLHVKERDLAMCPVPHPDAAFVAASLADPATRTPVDHAALAMSEVLIEELERADAILISTPMHNFTIPSVLKAWVDHVVRPGRTFRSTARGKQPMLANRPVRVLLACGGDIRSGTGHQPDWASPYLRDVFDVMGMRDVDIRVLENCNRGPMQ
ncbi:MAG: NAD(P)H-dependent oxidoreductase [Rhodocyclales bacterium]|nr:NAD(P)H-dependent oxidoreductase [Rhodocyclales bacterium]